MHGAAVNMGTKELSAGTTCSQAGETEQVKQEKRQVGILPSLPSRYLGLSTGPEPTRTLDSPEATRVGPVRSLLHLF